MKFSLKRVYDLEDEKKACRVLVDRLWPRGIAKEKLQLDEWPKSLCPSNDLRKWLHADKSRWEDFCEKYRNELAENETEIWDFYDKVKEEE